MGGFGRYLAAALAARFASEGMGLAVVMLALERTGSAAYGAFALTAWLAPHVLAAPLAGAAAARTGRPRVLYAGALAGFTVAVAALAVLLGRAPTPVVLAVAVLGGTCGPMVTGGLSSLVAGLVPAGPGRDRAYGWDASTYNAAAVTAPAVVGLTAAFASAAPAMAVLAASGALAAALAATLPYEDPGAGPRPGGPGAGLGAGLAALWRVRELRAITAATTLAFVGIGSLTTTSVLRATGLGSPQGGGVLMTCFAVGALAGSLTLGRITTVAPGRLAVAAMATTGVALVAAAFAPSLALTAVAFAVAGVCDGPLLTATLRIRSEYAPDGARAQVFTLGAGLKLTAASAGAALVGLAAAAPPWTLLLGIAALQLAAAALHVLVAPRGKGARAGDAARNAAQGADGAGVTGPSAGSATAATGPRTPGAP
ncbi:MFS transporter [Streptomyces sp. NBC_00249]|uniref:MFS transporter n=1 Tax=Streptomyces sp. NBC_00249 TaxID=2975690 RepID=UPI002254AE50|nr:MFS transporter [Streptomyces sp. NBC_00249]MCX5197167.1 MFS transporter [Streptomyces sp. NBC_00249]